MISKEKKTKLEKQAKGLKRSDYVVMNNGVVQTVFCKCCGNKLQDMKPIFPHRTYEKDGKDYIISTLTALNNYSEITFEFEDGS